MAVVAVTALAACSPAAPPADPTATAPPVGAATTGGAGDTPPPARPPVATPDPGTATPGPVVASSSPPSPARPAEATPRPDGPGAGWTTGVVENREVAVGVATLQAIRVASHEGFDRVVFELSPTLPGYHLEYVDKPVRGCGSGEVVPLPGDGWLEVRLEPAAAHTEEGRPTVGREVAGTGGNLRLLKITCDFEAVVTWVLAVDSPNAFRVSRLDGPPRLVVDVRR